MDFIVNVYVSHYIIKQYIDISVGLNNLLICLHNNIFCQSEIYVELIQYFMTFLD